jgi:hypothetical protein
VLRGRLREAITVALAVKWHANFVEYLRDLDLANHAY